MRVVVMVAVMLVLLVVMVGSVSADVIIDPPPFPNSAPGDSVSPDEGKATPILFRNRATSGTENVVIEPPPFPDSVSDVIVPAVQKVREA